MTIDPGIACLLLGTVIALQGWQLREIILMKIKMAALNIRLKSMTRDKPDKDDGDSGDTELFR